MQGPRKRSFQLGPGLLRRGAGEEAASDEAASDEATASEATASDQATGGEVHEPSRSILSRKELARELRRQAYQKAKLARANDPRHLAMKERARQQRRELYRKAKEQRKAREATLEAKHEAARASARADAKREIGERVRAAIGRASKPEVVKPEVVKPEVVEPESALAHDVERALEDASVRELMERLRVESASLAARHRLVAHETEVAAMDDARGPDDADDGGRQLRD
jgi:hypothetical protein